jgi:hypothetical protein
MAINTKYNPAIYTVTNITNTAISSGTNVVIVVNTASRMTIVVNTASHMTIVVNRLHV